MKKPKSTLEIKRLQLARLLKCTIVYSCYWTVTVRAQKPLLFALTVSFTLFEKNIVTYFGLYFESMVRCPQEISHPLLQNKYN